MRNVDDEMDLEQVPSPARGISSRELASGDAVRNVGSGGERRRTHLTMNVSLSGRVRELGPTATCTGPLSTVQALATES
jgi:hypothetical protein